MKRVLLVAAVFALGIPVLAGMKIRVDADKAVDFTPFKTWAWSDGIGDVMLARTPKDDPEELRKRAEPIIVDAVATQMPKSGLQLAKDNPDLTLRYYMLITIGNNTQQMGQFVPTVLDWGIPL